MIDIQVKLHDRYSVECKVGYHVDRDTGENEFRMNAWFFIPHSLDINASTYPKEAFYRDVKSNVRLITPIYTLEEIASGEWTPFVFLEDAFQHLVADGTRDALASYEYQIKMFTSIFKSALRGMAGETIHHEVESGEREGMVDRYVECVQLIVRRYRDLKAIINVPEILREALNYFSFGDEYLSNLVEFHTYVQVTGRVKDD